MTKESLKTKIFTIIVTAAISAAIALLQTLLTHYLNSNAPVPDPEVAGGIGAALRTGYYIFKERIC
jgi:hypothetical protein